jgi:hypothetical protein
MSKRVRKRTDIETEITSRGTFVIRPEIRLNRSKMSHLGGVDQEGSIPMKNDDQLIGNLIDLIKEARRKQGFDVP